MFAGGACGALALTRAAISGVAVGTACSEITAAAGGAATGCTAADGATIGCAVDLAKVVTVATGAGGAAAVSSATSDAGMDSAGTYPSFPSAVRTFM
jgi:hypothetical protein